MNDAEYNAIRPHNRDHYGLPFFKFTDQDHGPANLLFGRVLYDLFRPRSVVDFGCGTAGELSSLLTCGVHVVGIDSSPACLPLIQRRDPNLVHHIQIWDLERPWAPSGSRFDLAISIECFEHLSPSAADTIVTTVANSAASAVVTACPPAGGNELHLNEQPFTYWIERFEHIGSMMIDSIATEALKTVMRSYATAFEKSEQRYSCLVPSWFYDSYIGVFIRR